MTARRREAHRRARRDLKDRLIQTRVPEQLESVLKQEAERRRLSVSHLIRNVLEDTLKLVDNVVAGSEEIAANSARIVERAARDARKIATSARAAQEPAKPDEARATPATEPERRPSGKRRPNPELENVLAWNAVVLNRNAECANCGTKLLKGSAANLGLAEDRTALPLWLCPECLEKL